MNSTERKCTRKNCLISDTGEFLRRYAPLSNKMLKLRTTNNTSAASHVSYTTAYRNTQEHFTRHRGTLRHQEHFTRQNSSVNKHTLTCQKIAFKGISIKIIALENDPANLRLLEAFRHIRNTSLLSTLDRNAANSRIAIPKHYLRSLTVYLGFSVIPTLLARFPKHKHFAEYSFYP